MCIWCIIIEGLDIENKLGKKKKKKRIKLKYQEKRKLDKI